jgi:acyl-homoserine lactone acylase PvdQ
VTDRDVLMEALRGPGRIAAIDAPGLDAFALAEQLVQVNPSAQTEEFIGNQAKALEERGARGRRILRDIDMYVAGINAAYQARQGVPPQPWTRNDVFAIVALLAGVFGEGGGDEARNAEFLDGLRDRMGAEAGRSAFDDLRAQYDAEHAHMLRARFPYGRKIRNPTGNVVLDNGSFDPVGSGLGLQPPSVTGMASNALLTAARRSTNGHPNWAAGPQVGYFYPEILMETDLHGGGIDSRGVGVPGFSFAHVIGRGQDFAWSLTSATNDIVDHYAETLCGDDTHYVYQGQCREMGTFAAGTLEGLPFSPQVSFRTTVHGPVIGYATVDGRRVAISQKRSTRGREAVSAFFIEDLMTNRIKSARDFVRSASSQFEVTFNAFYTDDRDIAVVSTGRLPIRAPGVDMSLPTIGDGRFEWRGFLPARRHPQAINPPRGAILNWNQKPSRSFSAADDNWSYGSVHRVELFDPFIDRRRRHSLASVVAAMNGAATQDLRVAEVLPSIDRVLSTGPAPSPREQRMLELLRDWRAKGSSRLDRDGDGKIDHAGAAIMDAAWEKLAEAVLEPALGSALTAQLADMHDPDDAANNQGSSYGSGWYGYVDKDLRRLTGARVRDPFATRFCGAGDLGGCRDSLWTALKAAGDELAESQSDPNPDAWRADATRERIRFLPGLLPRTMRWTNRPTFQQVLNFTSHRPRPTRRGARRRAPAFTGSFDGR